MSHVLVTLEDIESAARTLAQVAVRTPVLPADAITELVGAPIFIKPEMLQRGGAFKFRGAYNYLSRMDPAARSRGVVAPSSGNHAQAVALAAKLFGVKATVVMPTTVTPAKRGGAERLGARVELAGTTTADRMARAQELVEKEGLTLVPPYDPTIRVPSKSRKRRIHSGCAGQAGADTRFPSTTTVVKVSFTSVQRAPAASTSGLTAGYAVHVRPFSTPAVASSWSP